MTHTYRIELLRITTDESIEFYDGRVWQVLDLDELKYNVKKPRLFFTDLQVGGMLLLGLLLKHKIVVTNTTYYKNVFYAIFIGNVVIKCYVCLGLEDTETKDYKVILKYLEDLNNFCITNLYKDLYDFKISSLASLALYFIKQCRTPLFRDYSEDILNFIKQAFFGGRCELLCPGKFENVASFDFPSMYGTILKKPFPLQFSWQPILDAELGGLPRGFIEATVKIHTGIEFPPLPYRDAGLGVIYPCGVFRGVFGWEELALLDTGYGSIVAVHKVLYASHESTDFAEIAQKLLDLRFGGSLFAKRVLNSVYGRLAIEPAATKTKFFLVNSLDEIEYKPQSQLTLWRDLVILEQPCTQQNKIQNNKALAAIITARARCKLYKLAFSVQKEAALLYVDTDEVFVKPKNGLEFQYKYSHWVFYNFVDFGCERTYKAQKLYGLEYSKGILQQKHTSYKRYNLGCGLTSPHTVNGRTTS